MKTLYRIPDLAQEFQTAPKLIEDGNDLLLRYDYETEDGSYAFRDILFINCKSYRHQKESEIEYSKYRKAYNSIASDGTSFYIFFDGYGLYTICADTYRLPSMR